MKERGTRKLQSADEESTYKNAVVLEVSLDLRLCSKAKNFVGLSWSGEFCLAYAKNNRKGIEHLFSFVLNREEY